VTVTAPTPRQSPADHAYDRPLALAVPGRQGASRVALTHSLILVAISCSSAHLWLEKTGFEDLFQY